MEGRQSVFATLGEGGRSTPLAQAIARHIDLNSERSAILETIGVVAAHGMMSTIGKRADFPRKRQGAIKIGLNRSRSEALRQLNGRMNDSSAPTSD